MRVDLLGGAPTRPSASEPWDPCAPRPSAADAKICPAFAAALRETFQLGRTVEFVAGAIQSASVLSTID